MATVATWKNDSFVPSPLCGFGLSRRPSPYDLLPYDASCCVKAGPFIYRTCDPLLPNYFRIKFDNLGTIIKNNIPAGMNIHCLWESSIPLDVYLDEKVLYVPVLPWTQGSLRGCQILFSDAITGIAVPENCRSYSPGFTSTYATRIGGGVGTNSNMPLIQDIGSGYKRLRFALSFQPDQLGASGTQYFVNSNINDYEPERIIIYGFEIIDPMSSMIFSGDIDDANFVVNTNALVLYYADGYSQTVQLNVSASVAPAY